MSDDIFLWLASVVVMTLILAGLLLVGIAVGIFKLICLLGRGLRRVVLGPEIKREPRRIRREHRAAIRDITSIRHAAERRMQRAARRNRKRPGQIARW